MSACEIVERPSFKRSLRRLSTEYRQRVRKALADLSKNPRLGEGLRGRYEGLRKWRVGDYRVIYDYVPCKIVLILVEHRETVYRRR